MKSALFVEGKHSSIQPHYHPLGLMASLFCEAFAGFEEDQDSLCQFDLLWHTFCFTYFLHGRVRLFIFLSSYLSICPSIHSFIHKIPKCLSKKTQNHAMTASHACGQRKPLMSSLHIISCMNLLRCLSLCTSDGHSSFRRQTFAFTEYVIFHTTWNFLLPFTVLAPVKGHHCCCIKSQFLIAGL